MWHLTVRVTQSSAKGSTFELFLKKCVLAQTMVQAGEDFIREGHEGEPSCQALGGNLSGVAAKAKVAQRWAAEQAEEGAL